MRLIRPMAMLLACAFLQPSVASADDGLSAALTAQLERNRVRYGIAGQALLVIDDGRVVFRGVEGLADVGTGTPVAADHVFAGYSLSKLFVSVLVLQLVEQGRVDLDTAVGTYVHGLPAHWRSIAVRDFLDHTSGVPEYFDPQQDDNAALETSLPATLDAVWAALADRPLAFAPGTDIRYTQTNYLVLSAVLVAQYGTPYPRIVDERLLRPLRLRHTWLGRPQAPVQVVTRYTGRQGRLAGAPDITWPDYAMGHAGLHITLDDLGRFLQAVNAGELVDRAVLRRAWQPRTLPDGRRGWFAGGWEQGRSGAYRLLGHDGGAQVRVRIVFDEAQQDGGWIIAYLTNGSAKNVWSRTLVDGVMARIAPERFPVEALSESLQDLALRVSEDGDVEAQAAAIRASTQLDDAALERAVNNAGYGIRENFGTGPALRVFALNTVLFPASANAWDSLAETHALAGDAARAQQLYERARTLASPGAPAVQQ